MTAPPPQPPPEPGGPGPQSGGDLSGVQPQADNDKLLGALCYIFWILVPVIILVTDMKESRFAKIHAYQGLVFGAAGIAFYIIYGICSQIIVMVTVGVLWCILWVGFFLPFVAGVYFAYLVYTKGQVVLPGVTDATRAVFKDL